MDVNGRKACVDGEKIGEGGGIGKRLSKNGKGKR